MSQTVLEPEVIDNSSVGGRWMVVIFNDDSTYVGKVIKTLMRATKCTIEEAKLEVWEAEKFGKASVHFANRQECEDAATIIRAIGVKVEVSPEWND